MKKIFLLLLLVFSANIMFAKPKNHLFVSVLQTKNYVVGRANDPSGLYKFDKDTIWTHFGWKNVRNFGISVDESDVNCILLACGNGVMRSFNGGKSFKITTDWKVTEVLDVSIDHFNSDNIYCATPYGIWKTSNKGDNWKPANTGLKHKFIQEIEPDRSIKDRLFAGGESGLYGSDDGAVNWIYVDFVNVPVRDIHQNLQNNDLWIVGTEDKGVVISPDNGKTWTFADGQIGTETIYTVSSSPKNPDIIAAAGFQTGVYISTDGGTTWIQKKEGLPIHDIHALTFDPTEKNKIWVGTLGKGVYYSDDLGDSWTYAGLNGAEIWDILIIEGK